MEHAKHEEFDVMPRSVDDVPAGQGMHAWKLEEGGWVVLERYKQSWDRGCVSWSSRTHAAVDGALEIFVVRCSKVALAVLSGGAGRLA